MNSDSENSLRILWTGSGVIKKTVTSDVITSEPEKKRVSEIQN